MQVLIRSKSFRINQALQEFVHNQCLRLEKPGWKLLRVDAFLEKNREQTRAIIKIRLPKKDIVVKQVSGDVYQAISQAIDRSKRAVFKQHEKQITLRRRKMTFA